MFKVEKPGNVDMMAHGGVMWVIFEASGEGGHGRHVVFEASWRYKNVAMRGMAAFRRLVGGSARCAGGPKTGYGRFDGVLKNNPVLRTVTVAPDPAARGK
jgi:hypothetical protein